MDPNYNIEEARDKVDAAATAYDAIMDNDVLSIAIMKTKDYQLTYVNEPPSWRIIHAHNGDESEEIFQIYGILCASDLPPIETKNISNLRGRALCLRQGIRLTGLASNKFNEGMDNVERIYTSIDEYMNNIKLQWEPATYEGYKAIDISARYFTARKYVPNEKGQTFEHGVDPKGVLAQLRGQDLIHGSDNKVTYLMEVKDDENKYKLIRILPDKFTIGDLVRATFSFVVFPTRDNGAKMTLVLKALTLIDCMVKKKSYKEIKNSTTIKRKIIFEDDEDIRARVANMSLRDTDMNKISDD